MINIHIQDEAGRTKAEFGDSQIAQVLLAVASSATKCLQFIDPYGDTTFNGRQAEVLAGEIEVAAASLPEAMERERALALAAFSRRVAAELHTYLKFIGD
jgi:hypothetical protein